ncbi:MAG: alkyl sulfatase dimerization domain-containing protein [Gammaproteobacteria bacterium]|jgi:alkyl sulfatase BDS1-like metallo-beta-lactamase superfamily hydrolase|nr:alkyl sulfatase dimerization domain-containing protein [Gammaproteobacteria bacterium]
MQKCKWVLRKLMASLPLGTLLLAGYASAQIDAMFNPGLVGRDQTEAIRISDTIFQATGFGNTNMVVTPAGNVIIDTSLIVNARRHKQLLQAANDGPVKYIILTHAHGDHIGGVSAWREKGTEIIAQDEHYEFVNYQNRLKGLFSQRNAAQFPSLNVVQLSELELAQGVENFGAEIVPTILFEDDYRFELGGVTFDVLHTPGETYDHLSVWIPDYKAAFVGDNFYTSFPNMYTLRGTKPRWALDYVDSINRILALQPEILVPSHGDAILGVDEIERQLTRYRDAILYVHDQTVLGMNQGKDVHTLMAEIVLPSDLDIGEGYGRISWSVRGIYESYMGWFDGNPSTMFNTAIDAAYPDIVRLAGGANGVAELAETQIAEGDLELALHTADIALRAEPSNVRALTARLSAFQALLEASDNSNEIGWLQFGVRESQEALDAAGSQTIR